LLSAVDITERKKAENELKIKDNAIASSNTAIAIGEFGGNLTYANPMFLKMWGYDDVKEVLGKPAVNFWLTKEKAQDIIEALLKGEPVAGELKAKRKDGSLFDVQLSASLVTDDTGKPISMMASFVDITEQKQAEEKLRASEERFRTICETAQDFIALKDSDCKFTYVNSAMERIFGIPASKLIGKTSEAIFGKERSARIIEEDLRVLRGEIVDQEHPSPIKGGSTIHHIIKVPIRNSDGEIIGLCNIGRDITERKQIEEALRESEERFRTIVEQAAEAIIAHDLDGRVLLANSLACEYSGYSQEELLSMNVLVLDNKILEKDYKRKYWEKLQIGKYVKVESTHIRKDGSSYPAEVYLVKIMFKNQPIILCLARDITERKKAEEALQQSEERFRRVVETMEVGLGAIDQNGVFTYVNEYFSKMLGYSIDEMIGRSTFDFFYDEKQRQTQQEMLAKRRAGMRDPTPYEVAWENKDERIVYSILSPTPIFDADGRYTGSFAIHTDITERKQMEEALRESEERFRAIFEGAPDAIFLADPESGRILDANPAASDLLLRPHEEVIGLHQSQLHPSRLEEQIKEVFVEDIQQFKRGKGLRPIESAVMRSDGSEVPVEILGHMVFIHGRPVLQGTFRDITERKQADEALKKSEEKYRLLSENIPVAVYSALPDEHSTNLFLSGQFLELTGYPIEQFFKDPELWSSVLHPEDRDYVWEKVREHRRIKDLLEVEYRIITKDKKVKWIRDRAKPVLDEHGEIMRIDGFMEDVSERKQTEQALRGSEEKYRSLVESSEDSIYLVDRNCNYIFLNNRHLARLGVQSNEIIGKGYSEFHNPEESKDFAKRIKTVLKTGKPQSYEYQSQRDNRYFIRTLSPVTSLDREINAITVISKDITERKLAEEALREREAFNYALFHYNPVETIVVDREGRVTGFNLAKEKSGDRLPAIGDRMYQDYACRHEMDMRAELMNCIRSGKSTEFPERKYGDKYLNITVSPFAEGAIIISEDITERKRAEEALRESEQFSSSLLNDSPNPIIVINPDTSIRYVNPALEKLTGFSAAELLGRKAPYPWWGDEIISETTTGLKRALQQGSQRLEKYFQTKSGDQFWVEITSEPVMHDEKVQYLITSWIDITERKRAEKLLQRERDTFYSILERAPYGVMVLDTAGNHSFVNPEFTNITGYTLEDIPTTQEWLHRAYPDQHYRNMVMEMWESDCAQSKDEETFRKRFGRTFARTFNVMSKNGVTKDIEFRTTVIGAELTIVMLSDITDRKRMNDLLESAAAEWRTTFDAISDAVCLLDSHGKIIRCNNAMLKLLGKPFSQVTNHHCWEVMHGVSEAPHSCPIALAGKTNHRESEVMFKDSCWFNISVDPLFDEDGHFLGGVHIMSDITDRMHIQNELQDSREQLRNLTAYLESVREQERTNIAREIHDELAQALTALKMDLSWLNHKLPGEEGSLIEKTKSMNSLIDSTIHTVKRISAELRPGILDDLGLVAAIEWQTEEFQNRTGISCHVIVDPDDIAVDQDLATAIFRIFQETLTNVARHARATRVTVNLKKRAGKLTLRVKDNGIGITEEQISDSRSFGLIGMHERVIPWDGKISLKGIPDKGTTVIVSVGLDHAKKNIDKNSREGSPA
jgi:PAS domain S-box-containing protein